MLNSGLYLLPVYAVWLQFIFRRLFTEISNPPTCC